MNSLTAHLPLSQVSTRAANSHFPWILIFGRCALFIGVQSLFALAFFAAGSPTAWEQGANWWPLSIALSNLICLAFLVRLFQAEGSSYWEVFRIRRGNIKRDLLAFLGWMLIAGPAGYFPNVLLAGWIFGDSMAVLDLFIRPLPLWAAIAGIILFPLTQGLVEIPLYFAYGMPRLKAQGLPSWLALTIPALMLGLQHIAVPFLFDLRFITWRAFMFIPFAFVVGLMMRQPRLQPYLSIVHVLMNLSLAAMMLTVAF